MTLEAVFEPFNNDSKGPYKEEVEIIQLQTSKVTETQLGIINKQKFILSPMDLLETEPIREVTPFSTEQRLSLAFKSAPKPWLPSSVLQKLSKMKKTPLRKAEMVALVEDIVKISTEFYQVKLGTFIAIKLDGRIVEAADTEIDLLLKIQGKKFDTPVIVWETGSESFSGWRSQR